MIHNLNAYTKLDIVTEFTNESVLKKLARHGKLFFYNATICIEFYASKSSTNIFCEIYLIEQEQQISLNNLLAKSSKLNNVRALYKEFSERYNCQVEKEHINFEINFAFYLYVIKNIFDYDLINEALQQESALQSILTIKKNLISSIVNGNPLPIYYQIRTADNPELMGVVYPQINAIDKQNEIEAEKLNAYKGQVNNVDISTLDLDVFLMKVAARDTNFISSYYLKDQGFFINKILKENLSPYTLNSTKIVPLRLNKNYAEAREAFFLHLYEDTQLIDFKNSLFVKRYSKTKEEDICFKDYECYEKAVQACYEEMKGYRIVPKLIYLSKYPDVFKFPLSNYFFVSASCLEMFRIKEITGYETVARPFSIF